METYRSGHNGADSKSVREQSPASSNLAVSASLTLNSIIFGFSVIFCLFLDCKLNLLYFAVKTLTQASARFAINYI